jgi:hypothetical protein
MDGFKLALLIAGGVLAALGVAALILGLIPARSGLIPADKPVTIRVSSAGGYLSANGDGTTKRSFQSGNATSGADFTRILDEYERATSYSVLLGVLEFAGAPRARVETRGESWSAVNEGLKKSEATTAEDGTQIPAPVEYTLTVVYASEQELTLRDGEGEEFAFAFDTVTLKIVDENALTDIAAYAFVADNYGKDGYTAVKLKMTAKQVRLFRTCAELISARA